MLSALTHVGSDTLRTTAEIVAACIAIFGGYPSGQCDAWAAVVVSGTIVLAVIPLCKEIYLSYQELKTQMDEPGDAVTNRLHE